MLHTFYMPTLYSSQGTRGAAEQLGKDVGAHFTVIAIEEAFDREREATMKMLDGAEPTPVTDQNIQARLRGARLWNWANTSSALFLQTGT